MYENKITVAEETLGPILNGASHFLIESLRAICAQYMICNLGPQNVLRTWALAELYTLKEVIPLCEILAKARFHDYIINHASAMEVPKEFLVKMINDGVLDCTCVPARAKFLIQWTNQDLNERGPQLVELLGAFSRQLGIDLRKTVLQSPQSAISYLENYESGSSRRSNSRLPSKLGRQRSTRNCKRCDIVVSLVKKKDDNFDHFFSHKGSVHLYGYIPDRNQWLELGSITLGDEQFSYIKGLLGFVQDSAVFLFEEYDKKVGFANLKTNTISTIDGPTYPVIPRDSLGPVQRTFFCFDDNVFCIVEQVVLRRKKRHSNLQASFMRAVFVLQGGVSWKRIGDLPLDVLSSTPSCSFNTHVIGEEVYVLARLNGACNSTGVPQYRTTLHVIRKRKNTYTLSTLKSPGNGKGEKINMGTSLDGNLILMLGTRFTHNATCVLVYDKSKDSWRSVPIEPTPTIEVGEHFAPDIFNRNTIYNQKCQMKNLKNLYAIDMPCPFVSRLLHYCSTQDKKGKKGGGWKVLPGPPILQVKEFCVTTVNLAFLDDHKSSTQFTDSYLQSDRSPFFTKVIANSTLHADNAVQGDSTGSLENRYTRSYAREPDSSSSDRYSDDDYMNSNDYDDDDEESYPSSGGEFDFEFYGNLMF